MAAVDTKVTAWGILVGGTGTDATTITTGRLRVKAMAFAGNADNATCALTTVEQGAATSVYKWKTNADDLDCGSSHVYFGEYGIELNSPVVTISHADDRLYLFLV
jgi:hypothetical protein